MSIRPVLTLLFVLGAGGLSSTRAADSYLVGIYADPDRSQTCVEGPIGSRFQMRVFAWTPVEQGLVYVTLRLDFPQNLGCRSQPVLNQAVTELIVTDYSDGTVEWNLLFDGSCPSEWVEIVSQECVLLDEQTSRIGIASRHSMIRDCDFVLEDVTVVSDLAINPPDCGTVSAGPINWGVAKARYR